MKLNRVTEVIIAHGTGGHPRENWFPWLKSELKTKGVSVAIPSFPKPEKQNLKSWQFAFSEQIGELEDGAILVGHSIGCALVLRILEESNKKARAIFLVSAWQGLLNSEEFDPLIKTFFDTPFNFEKIRANVEAIYQYHGDNDPYVPLGMAKELSINLKSKLSVIKAGGHLNEAAGFVEFPLLRDDLFAVLRK